MVGPRRPVDLVGPSPQEDLHRIHVSLLGTDCGLLEAFTRFGHFESNEQAVCLWANPYLHGRFFQAPRRKCPRRNKAFFVERKQIFVASRSQVSLGRALSRPGDNPVHHRVVLIHLHVACGSGLDQALELCAPVLRRTFRDHGTATRDGFGHCLGTICLPIHQHVVLSRVFRHNDKCVTVHRRPTSQAERWEGAPLRRVDCSSNLIRGRLIIDEIRWQRPDDRLGQILPKRTPDAIPATISGLGQSCLQQQGLCCLISPNANQSASLLPGKNAGHNAAVPRSDGLDELGSLDQPGECSQGEKERGRCPIIFKQRIEAGRPSPCKKRAESRPNEVWRISHTGRIENISGRIGGSKTSRPGGGFRGGSTQGV